MKKILALLLAVIMVMSLAACGGEKENTDDSADDQQSQDVETQNVEDKQEEEALPEFVTITTYNGDKELVEIEVPYNPERIAVMDLAVLDMVDNYGFGDRIVGVSKGSSIDYLAEYVNDDSIANLGTIKECDLEAVMQCEPEIIFIGGRLSSSYDALSEIAPVVFLATDTEMGLIQSVSENAMTIASIFGAEEQVSALLSSFDDRIAVLKEAAQGKTAFVGMLNAGSLNMLGNDGRCSIIGVEIGFDNIGLGAASEKNEETNESQIVSAHGTETSFEFIARLNPDYIFVMNRDSAIGTEGAQPAQEVVENELIMKTDAYNNGNIVYLEHSNVWYTAEGGITALDYMLRDLEAALLG